MIAIIQDLRYAIRMLMRNPGFTAVAVLTLALGIGATTAIFTVFYAVLLRPLPYPRPGELVYIKENLGPPTGTLPFAFSRDFAAWRNRTQTLSQLGAYMFSSGNLTGGGEAARVNCGVATASFFTLLGTHAQVGRVFLAEEDRPGSPPAAILSHALWKRRYSGDPSVVGRELILDGKTYTVVGVLPADFIVPDRYGIDYDLWLPLAVSETGPGPFPIVRAIGRLKSGLSAEAARAELESISKSAGVMKGLKRTLVVSAWQEEVTSGAKLALLLFLGAVGLLLLIACVNVANLLLSRAAARQKEVAVRLAVGAPRRRIVQQLVTESTLLALLGGLLGLGLARWGKDLLVKFLSPNLPALQPMALDWRVLGFNLGLAVLTGLAFGLAPALQASGVSLNETLKESSRGTSEVRSRFIFRNLLIVCETALALVLLAGAGLLFKSFLRVRGIEMGFKSENVLCMSIDLTPSKYPTPNAQAGFFQQAIERIKGLEGVRSVAGSGCPPLGNRLNSMTSSVEGQPGKEVSAFFAAVTPDYFRTMAIPLLQGRYFTDADGETSPSVAIVDESFARRYFPGANCLGKRIGSWVHEKDWLTIVGIVGDVRDWPDREPQPAVYLPHLQAGEPYMTLLVRTAGNPRLWAPAIRSQVASLDKDQPPWGLATLDEIREKSLTTRRVNMLLLGTFAGLGLILASVGIYGVVSYSVSHRTHEIGVRMAMGAKRGDVLKLVVGQGLSLALIGTGIGLAISLGVARLLRTMLFGVKPADPLTLAAVSLLLTAVALLASYLPARRAMRVDPMVALRYE